MLDHSRVAPSRRPFSRRAAAVGAELGAIDDKPKATLGETLVFLIPAFVAGLILAATLSLTGSDPATKK